jgi:hypothetical protein
MSETVHREGAPAAHPAESPLKSPAVADEDSEWWIVRVAGRSAYGTVLAIIGFLAAVTGSISAEQIKQAFPFCCWTLSSDLSRAAGSVFSFWGLAGLWAGLLWAREVAKSNAVARSRLLANELKATVEQTHKTITGTLKDNVDKVMDGAEQIKAAVSTFPPVDFVNQYADMASEAHRLVSEMWRVQGKAGVDAREVATAIGVAIRALLTYLASLARTYDERDSEYGANVMEFLPRTATEPYFQGFTEERLTRYLPFGFGLNNLDGVLILRRELSVESVKRVGSLGQVPGGSTSRDALPAASRSEIDGKGETHDMKVEIAAITPDAGGGETPGAVPSGAAHESGEHAALAILGRKPDVPLVGDRASLGAVPEKPEHTAADYQTASPPRGVSATDRTTASESGQPPDIIFPVLDEHHIKDERGRWRVLPGSATVFAKWRNEKSEARTLARGVRWVQDFRNLDAELGQSSTEKYYLDVQVSERLQQDYGAEGPQKHVRSFMAFPLIDGAEHAIGTLNIHCNMAEILGRPGGERILNFAGVVTPIVNDIAALLEAWQDAVGSSETRA